MSDDHRTVHVEGLANARDLGGLPLIRGGATPRGVFVRSESVDRVTPAGWQRLHDLGVRSVIDLRNAPERAEDSGERPAWLTTLAVDLDGLDETAFWADYEGTGLDCTPLYYLPHLTTLPERAGAVLAAIAGAPAGGVLFHCAAGRDRTGLVAVLLLALAGAEPAAVVDDYLQTVRRGALIAAAWQQPDHEPAIADLLAARGTTSERALHDVLQGLDVEQLLAAAALDDGAREALRTWRGGLTA